MSRLQKKCFVASWLMHGLLGIVLIVGPAFLGSRHEETIPVIDLFDAKLTDGPTRGGTPNAQPTPLAPAVKQQQQVVVPLPQPTPQVSKQTPKNDTEKIKPLEKGDIPIADKKPTKPTTSKTTGPKVDLSKTVKRTADSNTKSYSEHQTQKQREAASKALGSALNNIRANLSPNTIVGTPGAGGQAYANYGDVIGRIYQTRYDQLLLTAGDIAGGAAEVEAKIVIRRNGEIISATITKGSGNAALDRLVRKVLEQVREIPGFPEGARDEQRDFTIVFELKPKQARG
jgi:TonB family protein